MSFDNTQMFFVEESAVAGDMVHARLRATGEDAVREA